MFKQAIDVYCAVLLRGFPVRAIQVERRLIFPPVENSPWCWHPQSISPENSDIFFFQDVRNVKLFGKREECSIWGVAREKLESGEDLGVVFLECRRRKNRWLYGKHVFNLVLLYEYQLEKNTVCLQNGVPISPTTILICEQTTFPLCNSRKKQLVGCYILLTIFENVFTFLSA